MQITREWIMAHRTPYGAWTRYQIEALGLKWPMKEGWIARLVGKELSDEKARQFEAGVSIRAKAAKRLSRGEELPPATDDQALGLLAARTAEVKELRHLLAVLLPVVEDAGLITDLSYDDRERLERVMKTIPLPA